ncbi:MAG: SPFH domain-containing protein, partial [Gallionellaceae bacterium]|nr:SPFH domain-containing protein [Gallionellaceae bacterium]
MSDPQDKVTALLRAVAGNGGGRSNAGKAPSGGGTRGYGVLLLIALGLVVWGISSSFYTVQPEERAVVKRFGKVVSINDPGLHFKLPFGVDTVQKVATERVMKQEFGFRTAGSSDERSAYSP